MPPTRLCIAGREIIPKAEYRETFENAGVGIAFVSTSGAIVDANSRFCELVGRSRDSLASMQFQDLTYQADLEANLTQLNDLIEGKISGYRLEKRYVRSNGELLWADLTVSAIRDHTGRPTQLISIVQDITRQKANEERLRFLLGEITHRTKNMTAVVQAVVNQCFSRAETKEALRNAILDRLGGIAASQDALAAGGDQSASMRDLIGLQLSAFLPGGDARIILEGEDVMLLPDAARAIGMALHELGTNACKYGALSSQSGCVRIAWENEAGVFRMSWREQDGPHVRPPERSGFGRLVIEKMVATSVAGDVNLNFNRDGVSWSLQAPSSAACVE